MKKKILATIFIAIFLLGVTACNSQRKEEEKEPETQMTSALAFKEDYESLNGTTNANGLEHRTVSINEENPFIISSTEEIIRMIENKETFYVYFGDKQCPWCRSVIEKAIEVANKKGIDKIYYIPIWDDNHNEILRDVYQLNDQNIPEIISEGSSDYSTLLKYFDNVLSDYTLTTTDGNKVSVGEKRIYAPNFIYVEDGKAKTLVSGTSSKQTNSREELTEELLNDEEEIFDEFFTNK